jgi:hypothetical protein
MSEYCQCERDKPVTILYGARAKCASCQKGINPEDCKISKKRKPYVDNKITRFPAETPAAYIKVRYHLAQMLKIDEKLYDKITDTPNFAFHFNEICNLARTGVVEGTAEHLMKMQLDYDLAKARQQDTPPEFEKTFRDNFLDILA